MIGTKNARLRRTSKTTATAMSMTSRGGAGPDVQVHGPVDPGGVAALLIAARVGAHHQQSQQHVGRREQAAVHDQQHQRGHQVGGVGGGDVTGPGLVVGSSIGTPTVWPAQAGAKP